MSEEDTLRWCLLATLVAVFPIIAYHRIKAHRTGESLDRREGGLFILATLRPIAFVYFVRLLMFWVKPARMAWSAVALPTWLRWCGLAMIAACGALLLWTLHTLGMNLTDTVVTRKAHTLVVTGPYRWGRDPFYAPGAALVFH